MVEMLFSLRLRWSSSLSCLSAILGTSSRWLLESTRCLRLPAREEMLFGIRVAMPATQKDACS